MTTVKRDYRAQYRRGQARLMAEGTRRLIIASARKLFGSRGYGATTLEAIARDAGVAVQTVYANFGTKRSILLELVKASQSEGELLPLIGRFLTDRDPAHKLRAGVEFQRRYYERSADVLRILQGAAASDPVIAKLAHVADEEVRQRCAVIVRGLARAGHLRKGLTQREATDVLAALCTPEIFRLLVSRSGWSPGEYEAWLVMTVDALLQGAPIRPILTR